MGPTTYLYVPGNKLDFVEKAFNKGAENIFIDLEDSIPVQLKSAVRDSVCNFLKEGNHKLNQNKEIFGNYKLLKW